MAKLVDVGSIASHFETLDDPCHTRNRKHLLVDIAVICIAAIVCGCDGPTAIHRWAALQKALLSTRLEPANGIPSHDCIRRLLIALKPDAFQQCFRDWTAAALPADPEAKPRLVAIAGRACRGSHDAANHLGPMHVVSAWASEEGIALGQVAAVDKSKEITAIPEFLKRITLTDTLVTIDAMGSQKEIVTQIADGGGDCVIAV
jgi:predicted transposase YbfD/YdcC